MFELRFSDLSNTYGYFAGDEGIVYGINQCEAKYMITSQKLLKKIDKMSDSIKTPLTVVYIGDKFAQNGEKLQKRIQNLTTKKGFKISTFAELEETGTKMAPYSFPDHKSDDLALIMYTSKCEAQVLKGENIFTV